MTGDGFRRAILDDARGPLESVCGWHAYPVLVRGGRVLAGPVPPPDRAVSHGICLACSARMIAKMPSPGPVVAGRMVAEAAAAPVVCRSCAAGDCSECKGGAMFFDAYHPSRIGVDACECSCTTDADPDGDYLRP